MGILITGSKDQLVNHSRSFFKREGINFFATDVELDITNILIDCENKFQIKILI